MGLFDSLKKGLDAVAKEVDLHKDDFTKELEKFATQAKATVEGRTEQRESAPVSEATPSYPNMDGEPREQFDKFQDIIARNFADCEVRSNVAARELDTACHPACTPIQFLFYRSGQPSLAVVLVKKNTYRGMNVIGTQEICRRLGIRYIRFYLECENEEAYVVNRIRENL